jgi:1-acyl-sn-glycerol-3-phosphate acyltransferase
MFFITIYLYLKNKTKWLWAFVGLLLIFMVWNIFKLELIEDINQIIPNNSKSNSIYNASKNIRAFDKLLVVVEGDTSYITDTLEQVVQHINNKLTTLTSHVSSVKYQIDESQIRELQNILYENLPLYIDDDTYDKLDSILALSNVDSIFNRHKENLAGPQSLIFKSILPKDPFSIGSSLMFILNELQTDTRIGTNNGYLTKSNSKVYILIVNTTKPSNDTKHNLTLIDSLNQIKKQLEKKYTNLNVNFTGAPVISALNAQQIKTDINTILLISILSIVILLYIFYRKIIVAIYILIPVSIGLIFALGLIGLFKGTISVIALASSTVIIGIAMDYAFHFLGHYLHTKSIEELLNDIVKPMLIGSISTIAAFYSLLFLKSSILNDFGLIAGTSLIGALLSALILLPHLINKLPKATYKSSIAQIIEKNVSFDPSKSKIIVIAALVISGVLIYQSKNVKFQNNLMEINFNPDVTVQADKVLGINDTTKQRTVFAVSKGKSIENVLQLNEEFTLLIQKKSNLNVKGLQHILLSNSAQKDKIARWNTYWTKEKIYKAKELINKSSEQMGFVEGVFKPFILLIDTPYKGLDENKKKYLLSTIFQEYIYKNNSGYELITPIIINSSQHNTETWSIDNNRFIIDRQQIYNSYTQLIKEEFSNIVLYSSIIVFIILLILYGRIELTLVAFLPMMLSWFCILGIMAMLDIEFNIVNIILSTFIFGLGDDYTIFFVDGLQKEYSVGKRNLGSYKLSVFLSAVSTIVGLGVLIFAKHPALKSIALISVIGMVTVVIVSYIFIPWLFHLLITNRTSKGLSPITMVAFLRTMFVYLYFILGCVILTLLGFILFIILRLRKFQLINNLFHTLLRCFSKSMIYIVFTIKKTIININNEKFKKSSILIANHQSMLDILLLLILTPKTIIVTNNWVWNSPLFGNIVKQAGFINASSGIESSFEKIKENLDQGYTVVIFPEGTRSSDLEIKRFHKGAFLLAEKYNVDILPVIIHGAGLSMPKGDLLLNRFELSLKILPRIKPSDFSWGTNYSDRTKSIMKYMRSEYSLFKNELSTTPYYYHILSSYLYKGPVIEWYYRIKVLLEKNYKLFDQLVPAQANILDIGCGYGFLDYYLNQKNKTRKILGIDYDEEKIAVAQNNYLKNDFIDFDYQNALTFKWHNNYDIILLLDVLHYLSEVDQKTLIKHAFDHLSIGGKLIIRDGDISDEKHKKTEWSEKWSINVTRFNKLESKSVNFISLQTIFDYLPINSFTKEIINDSNVTSNKLIIIEKK